MNKNTSITRDILCNNLYGSFFLVMWRGEETGKVDFIDPLRISVYHHLILKEGKKWTFPDVIETFYSTNQQDFCFNTIDNVHEYSDFWINNRDISESDYTPEEVCDTFIEILENKSAAMLHSKIPIFQKVCAYKVNVMRGQDLPVYKASIIGNSFKSMKLLSGDDILKDLNLTKIYKLCMQKIL